MHLPGSYHLGGPARRHGDALPLLRVTGEGRLEVAPDTAEVALGFSVRTPEATAAFQQTAAVLQRVVRVLLEMGIPRDQLQTEQISLFPVYERDRLVGYEGSTSLRVTLRDFAAIGPTVDRAVAAGANIVRGVVFTVRDPSAHEAAALLAAVQDAQRKAALLARSLGTGLGPVWRVEAEPAPGPIIPLLARAAPLEAIPILPGTLTFTRSVRVEYLLPLV